MNLEPNKLILPLCPLLTLGQAWAGPANYVHMPIVEHGESEIELRLGNERDAGENRESAAIVTVGTGLSSWWKLEIGAEIEHESDEETRLEAVEMENTFQLTEQGRYPVDVGLLVEIEKGTQSDSGWELKTGPLLQTEFGRYQINFNPLLERKFNTGQDQETEFVYEAQIKYRYQQQFEFGVQAMGELGEWNHWEDSNAQTHKAGPAIFGKFPLSPGQAFKYDLGLLFGLNDHTEDATLRATLEYEF